MSKLRKTLGGLALLGLVVNLASANDRHFVYSYESQILNGGDRELETYTTYRFGRDHFFSGLDESIEFETGLGDGVQTSLYLNFTQQLEDLGAGVQQSSPTLDGIANEWTFKLMDKVADGLGLGLILEPEFEPDELDLETRVIVDNKMGNWLWTFNLTAEPGYSWVDQTPNLSLAPSLGIGFFIVPNRFFLGAEVQNFNSYEGNSLQLTESILSLGPVVSYTGKDWWTTLTVLPQVVNFMGSGLDLTNSQRWQVRLGTSFGL